MDEQCTAFLEQIEMHLPPEQAVYLLHLRGGDAEWVAQIRERDYLTVKADHGPTLKLALRGLLFMVEPDHDKRMALILGNS